MATVNPGDFKAPLRVRPHSADRNGKSLRDLVVSRIIHLVHAFGYSMAGARVLVREKAAQLELIYAAIAMVILWVSGAEIHHWLISLVLFMGMLGMEALNTAIEVLVDHLSPQQSTFAKEAKDLGSFAVFCMIISVSAHLCYVVATRFVII